MTILDLFSKRQRRARGENPDVYIYDPIPPEFRVQLIHILHDFTGQHPFGSRYGGHTQGYEATKSVVDVLRKERGVFVLPPAEYARDDDAIGELANYILNESDTELFIDILELVCRLIERLGPRLKDGQSAKEAVEEVNGRLREHALGYEYVGGDVVRIDSQLVHVEAVKPALVLLQDAQFAGAEQEFRSAFDHYRSGKTKEALLMP